MIKRNLILIGLFIIMALFNAQMDIIAFNPQRAWFSGWWIESNWQQPLWQKYLLPMSVDGWHLCKFLMLSSFAGIIALLTEAKKWYEWFIVMVLWGLLFNLFYKM